MVKPKDNDQPAPTHRTSSGEIPPDLKSTRDIWDYIEILARPAAAFITALAVASIGIFGNIMAPVIAAQTPSPVSVAVLI